MSETLLALLEVLCNSIEDADSRNTAIGLYYDLLVEVGSDASKQKEEQRKREQR
jgi:hypothetical protein